MREGSLDAPVRHPIPWQTDDYYNWDAIDDEMRRVFDICHGCRRCFNLCDSFPRLFDLIDESDTGELDSVASEDFKPVVDACTLCDMCFMSKCPYVPPHEFNLDFPHLMLRYRAAEYKQKGGGFIRTQLAETDRIGRLAGMVSGVANWLTDTKNTGGRAMLEDVAGIHKEASLPKFFGQTVEKQAQSHQPALNRDAPNFGRKAVLYATCFSNFSAPGIGLAARAVLAKNGVETEVVYPQCCGMPQWEQGAIGRVVKGAKKIAAEMRPWIEKGYDIVPLVPSCSLMLKFEWPLAAPGDEDIKALSESVYDLSEYIVHLHKSAGMAPGLSRLDGGVAVHFACHARAQNIGAKAAEMLRLVPDTKVSVIERCSGHGGTWGIMKENFELALKVGKPAARQALQTSARHVVSECPLAGDHLHQGIERQAGDKPVPETVAHPIMLLARAYGFSY